ncbi:PTX3 protein, partial [Nothoprocta ornata]|nr:PTX3 protein [Nothoprocta pentlandii]NWX98268.1 PTX3 protein [Nothoprocta ornata]
DDYDLMYVNLDNEIEGPVLGTEETASCDCQREHTEWDKLFIMLENSQMKENMMLQAVDEILKAELQSLQAELRQVTGTLASTLTAAVEKVASHAAAQLERALARSREQAEQGSTLHAAEQGKVLERILLLSRNVSSRLGQLESAWHHEQLQETALRQQEKLGCETAILFPMRSKKIFGSVHPTAAMTLCSFTACIWIKVTEALDKTILFSYGTKMNPYEIQLYLSWGSAVLAVGSNQHKVTVENVVVPGKWIHLCGTWSSGNGTATLWVNGELAAATSDIADAHTIPDGGILQLGQEKNGCCVGGGFDEALAFSGKLTGFNMWDRVLSDEEIAVQSGEDACSIRGNIVGWGVTEVLPYGGAQYVS